MSAFTIDNLSKTLADLDAALGEDRLSKAVEDLEDQMSDLQDDVQARGQDHDRADWYQRQQLAELWSHLDDMQRTSVSRREVLKLFRKYYEDTQDIRAPVEEEPDELTKSVASFLKPGDTLAKAQRTAAWVVETFGRRGGEQRPYNRELASKLLVAKAISAEEHANWKTYGRLPDGVSLEKSQDRAQPVIDRQMHLAHMLAGMNVSPLALQHLLRTR